MKNILNITFADWAFEDDIKDRYKNLGKVIIEELEEHERSDKPHVAGIISIDIGKTNNPREKIESIIEDNDLHGECFTYREDGEVVYTEDSF